ncbi:DUF4179 domain-containing protein [Brevibacillus porteri]|uniref:DUF4179 domain-containing protein n=1 Tax=Brevibacillus porteri TaxID=2126350 RepID=A0ABX5FMX7_9BACL|nr:DUF4179 domain-containing protein [Brevibacillus porteri]MED1799844.1 DUF4179 domain-containing protein [Brevibacillus porteri]MED2132868.1 DUF4179 domain-containing protein [Brevibacillus porteri]MED2744219.1 DUF4179 domain-containing protein [Brevibacillus porteri]MED2816741.1 DUF4179 domain-containing protein [Brevibacillus porteri]MED2894315.1 DUF4179 domain-containing protein [Brevibacillus porteri]
MKCADCVRLINQVDRELSVVEGRQLQDHIAVCEHCQSMLLQEVDEVDADLSKPWPIVSASDQFTEKVMAEILQVEEQQQGPKRLKKWSSSRLWQKVGLTAAILLLALTVGVVSSPTLAHYVQSIFSESFIVEMQRGGDLGFSQKVNQKVTDQGITMMVDEILVDPLKMYVSIRFFTEKNQELEASIEFENKDNRIFLSDQNGKYIGTEVQHSYGFETLYLPENIPNDLILNLKVNRVDLHDEASKEKEEKVNRTYGRWHLKIPVSLEKSKSATQTIPIKKTYTSPQGFLLEADRLILTPMESKLILSSKMNEQELARMESRVQAGVKVYNSLYPDKVTAKEIWDFFGMNAAVMWEIVDEKGKVVMDTNGADGEFYGPIGPNKKLTYRTVYIEKAEPSDLLLTFTPAELNKQPLTFTNEGNTFVLKSFHIAPEINPAPGTSGYVGIVEAEFTYHQDTYEYRGIDAIGLGIVKMEMEDPSTKKDRPQARTITIRDFPKGRENQPVTITASQLVKRYENVNWSFDMVSPAR